MFKILQFFQFFGGRLKDVDNKNCQLMDGCGGRGVKTAWWMTRVVTRGFQENQEVAVARKGMKEEALTPELWWIAAQAGWVSAGYK